MSQQPININDKVSIQFSIKVDIKGYTSKTDFVVGTVEEKVIVRHVWDRNREPEYSTTYLIRFDNEYFLERSDDEKSRIIFNESEKYITSLTYCDETKELCDEYLRPKGIYLV